MHGQKHIVIKNYYRMMIHYIMIRELSSQSATLLKPRSSLFSFSFTDIFFFLDHRVRVFPTPTADMRSPFKYIILTLSFFLFSHFYIIFCFWPCIFLRVQTPHISDWFNFETKSLVFKVIKLKMIWFYFCPVKFGVKVVF